MTGNETLSICPKCHKLRENMNSTGSVQIPVCYCTRTYHAIGKEKPSKNDVFMERKIKNKLQRWQK